jgi:hypothetical protein
MIDTKIYDEWLKINVELHNKLEKLSILEKEKGALIKEAELNFSDELKKKMNKNINEYELLLKEINELKLKTEELKDKCQ